MGLSLKRAPRYMPRLPRRVAFITTAVLLPDDREVSIHIRNISPGGFMALGPGGLREGTRFGVSIPGRGIVRAEIRWAEADMFGARFEAPLEVQEVTGADAL